MLESGGRSSSLWPSISARPRPGKRAGPGGLERPGSAGSPRADRTSDHELGCAELSFWWAEPDQLRGLRSVVCTSRSRAEHALPCRGVGPSPSVVRSGDRLRWLRQPFTRSLRERRAATGRCCFQPRARPRTRSRGARVDVFVPARAGGFSRSPVRRTQGPLGNRSTGVVVRPEVSEPRRARHGRCRSSHPRSACRRRGRSGSPGRPVRRSDGCAGSSGSRAARRRRRGRLRSSHR